LTVLQDRHARLQGLIDALVARGQLAPLTLPASLEAAEDVDPATIEGIASALAARIEALSAHLA